MIVPLCINDHIIRDAPALSTEQDPLSVVTSTVFSMEIKDPLDNNAKDQDSAEQWDDEALVANTFKKNPVIVNSATGNSIGLRDMKSFDPKRIDPDNIAEKLRVEETKAQLAAAREGMEREAAKLKEEREKKEQAKLEAEKSRFGVSAGTGGKWVAPHLRSSGVSIASRSRIVPSSSQKLDVQDEELFPDLASADKILEKKEREQAPIFKAPKKTPVGGGANWASKPITSKQSTPPLDPKMEVEKSSDTVPVKDTEPETKVEAVTELVEEPIVPAVSEQETVTATQKTVVKKKKKDLSTFKPGS